MVGGDKHAPQTVGGEIPVWRAMIGYARVSTEEQHLDLQLTALKTYGCTEIYSDQGFSGARADRPGLRDALAHATRGRTLVVWRLDRLGRSLIHLMTVIGELGDAGVEFVSLTESIETRSPVGRFTFHMIAALAEFERSLIAERTRAGVASARARGSQIGRPPALSHAELDLARSLLATCTYAEVADRLGIHVRTLRRNLKQARSTHLAHQNSDRGLLASPAVELRNVSSNCSVSIESADKWLEPDAG
ncbi:recombinase family protein [Burkholderia pyrrocinia]|uniref:recombinase family protein n=1 Tax=Burkholderia pyrrocinia TaxID=60550 RepID=UPI00158A7A66